MEEHSCRAVVFFAIISISFGQLTVKLSKEERYLNGLTKVDFSPSAVLSDPSILKDTWIESPMPLQYYSKADKEAQLEVNEGYFQGSGFVGAYCTTDDRFVYKEDNAKLPIEQRSIDNEPITPYTWKIIDFERIDPDGAKTVINLMRPNWWIKALKATNVGNKVYLSISEQGISGDFKVTNIRTISLDTRFLDWKIENNLVSRPLTGKFEHQSYDVWEFEFDNGEIIGCTPSHPFYSEKQQAYIPVGDIQIGEQLRNKDGKNIAIKSKRKKEGRDTVYNLEVYRDHNFLVGYSGFLVHNVCYSGLIEDYVKNTAKYFKEIVEDASKVFYQRLGRISEMEFAQVSFIKNIKNKIPDVNEANFSLAKIEMEGSNKISNEYYTCFSGKSQNDLPNIIKNENVGYAGKSIKEAPELSNSAGHYNTYQCNYTGTKGIGPTRHNDAERKILESLRKDLLNQYPNAASESFKFKVTIHSELFPCASCTEVMGQFLNEFKGASIDIVTRTKGFIK